MDLKFPLKYFSQSQYDFVKHNIFSFTLVNPTSQIDNYEDVYYYNINCLI